MYLLILGALAALGAFLFSSPSRASVASSAGNSEPSSYGISEWHAMNNLTAFLGVIRLVESGDRYNIIAGGGTFSDYREHPFILNPSRSKPLGTTASGAYQMVASTWRMARDALGLTDFSPASQDKAAIWLMQNKAPGENRLLRFDEPRAYDFIARGDFRNAISLLRKEWEAFDKMLSGRYPITVASAESYFTTNGGNIA